MTTSSLVAHVPSKNNRSFDRSLPLQLADFPARRLAFIIFFAFANGPLGWSVSLLQNRLGVSWSCHVFLHTHKLRLTFWRHWQSFELPPVSL